MAGEFRGRCSDCGHAWDALEFGYSAADIDYLKPETYNCYFCPRCCDHLDVPRRVDRNCWQHWLAGHTVEVERSALLKLACDKILSTLSKVRTSYIPVEINIEPVQCPTCGENMGLGSIDNSPIICPRCGSRTARSQGIHAFVVVAWEAPPTGPANTAQHQ